jgi:uncharacterized membrane protein YfcA
MPEILIPISLGGLVGLVLALTGAGGGVLAVPLLVFGLHLSIHQAAPVGLLAVGLAAAVGAAIGLREGVVRYRAASLIGIAGMCLAPLGFWLAHRIPNTPLMIVFSAVLALSAWRMYVQSTRRSEETDAPVATVKRLCTLNSDTGRLVWTLPCASVLTATGVISGLLSGLLGVGGGFVIVPSLARHSDIPMRNIIATSLAVIALVSISGVATQSPFSSWGEISRSDCREFTCSAGSQSSAQRLRSFSRHGDWAGLLFSGLGAHRPCTPAGLDPERADQTSQGSGLQVHARILREMYWNPRHNFGSSHRLPRTKSVRKTRKISG